MYSSLLCTCIETWVKEIRAGQNTHTERERERESKDREQREWEIRAEQRRTDTHTHTHTLLVFGVHRACFLAKLSCTGTGHIPDSAFEGGWHLRGALGLGRYRPGLQHFFYGTWPRLSIHLDIMDPSFYMRLCMHAWYKSSNNTQ